MDEEARVQQEDAIEIVTAYQDVPYGVIASDLKIAAKDDYYQELAEIEGLYEAYDQGAKFFTEGAGGDYIPSDLRYKKAASIVNKEARFLFANPPDFTVNQDEVSNETNDKNTQIQDFLDAVLKSAKFNDKLLKACKDCFIAKRVACVLNYNEETGISITFLNALEFFYETADDGTGRLAKIVSFCNTVDTIARVDQRYFKKTYELENGVVYATDEIYDGLGVLLETPLPRTKTKFDRIPAVVILNDGLTGDYKGKSELAYLLDYESKYSKLANADIDAERKSMNPTRWTIDADPKSTKNLSIAPGAYWDLKSDDNMAEGHTASVGTLESTMAYSGALKVTLDRLENAMYADVDVPNINSEQLQGVITSGKTLKALYWGLSVRCDEKMLTWAPALEFIARMIIEGGRMYPNIAKLYVPEGIPEGEYEIAAENNYPLPEDEQEEKTMDITEVQAQAMSRKAYLKKWRRLTDEQAMDELKQILMEKQMFDESYAPPIDDTDVSGENNSSNSGSEDVDDSDEVDTPKDETQSPSDENSN